MTLYKLETAPDLADQVYRQLVDAISDGSLAPGLRITQEDLAERLAVSRQPVLQAIRLLRQDGLVLEAKGRGVVVAPLDALTVAHVYQVRSALDALAARLAATHRYMVPATLIAAGREAARGRDVKAMIDADAAFHAAVYAGSRNPMIEQSARQHWCHVRRAMGAVLQNSELRSSVWDEHAAIAGAIAAGATDEAERLMRDHGEQASRHMIGRLMAVLATQPPPVGDTA